MSRNGSTVRRDRGVWKQWLLLPNDWIKQTWSLILWIRRENILKQNVATNQTHTDLLGSQKVVCVNIVKMCTYICIPSSWTVYSVGVNSGETKAEACGDPESRATFYLHTAFICCMGINKACITPRSHPAGHTHTHRLFRVEKKLALMSTNTPPKLIKTSNRGSIKRSICTGGSELNRTERQKQEDRGEWIISQRQRTHSQHLWTHDSCQGDKDTVFL